MPELTYPEVGATDGELPPGYGHVRMSRRIGRGRDAFEDAAEALLTWQMHAGAGVRHRSGPDRATPGADVGFTWFGMRLECRVVSVIADEDRRGFTYGTLPRHPECGEERFVVSHDPTTREVSAEIIAFSRPSGLAARLAGPVGRHLQAHMTRRYLDALERVATRRTS